jgi:hypothetical protein
VVASVSWGIEMENSLTDQTRESSFLHGSQEPMISEKRGHDGTELRYAIISGSRDIEWNIHRMSLSVVRGRT